MNMREREPRTYRMTARQAAVEATRDAICAATIELWLDVPYDDMTLDEVATRAGVTRQTVLRHFESKENLVVMAGRWYGPQLAAMTRVEPGDVGGAIAALVRQYESMGDANIRMLSVEERIPPIHDALERGRTQHREWIESTFAPHLEGLGRRLRVETTDALYAATDVTLWKTLRRDLGRSARSTEVVLTRLVSAVVHDLSSNTEGAHR